MAVPTDDQTIIEAMTRELQAWQPRVMELTLRPESVFQLAAALQLAMRHPDVPDGVRETAKTFIGGARAFFEGAPTVQQVIDQGNEPDHVKLYREMETKTLRMAHNAFVADRQSARGRGDNTAETFCDERLAIIDAELRRRGDQV